MSACLLAVSVFAIVDGHAHRTLAYAGVAIAALLAITVMLDAFWLDRPALR